MANPALDVATHLAAISGLTLGTNLFVGSERVSSTQIPENSVFVRLRGGQEAIRVMGEATEVRRPTVNVRIRWNSESAGEDIAQAVHNSLSFNPSISGYLHVKTMDSSPDSLGRTRDGLHLWLVSVGLIHEQAAA